MGLNKKTFAEELGISAQTYTGYLHDRRVPHTNTLAKAIEVFNVSGTWLLTGQGEMFDPVRTLARMGRKKDLTNQAAASTIGDRIRIIRETFGLTKAAFARRIDVTRQTVHNLEIHANRPSGRLCAAVAQAFNVSSAYILRGEGPMFPGLEGADLGDAIVPRDVARELAELIRENRELRVRLRIMSDMIDNK